MSSSYHETPSSQAVDTAGKCLMLLSKVGESTPPSRDGVRAFECKTCGKKFPTFQALGGHRASHKKPKPDHDDPCSRSTKLSMTTSALAKVKAHECAICGAEFALGQALGGHMRRHRDGTNGCVLDCKSDETTKFKPEVPVLGKRVWFELDLNLTPRENDLQMGVSDSGLGVSDLKLQLGKREYEMRMESGRLQEYDLRMQIKKRRRFEDGLLGLVAL